MSKNNFGFSQAKLREIYIDEGIPQYEIRADDPINPLRPDCSGFWLKKMETE